MFKLKLNKIRADEFRTYTGYQSEIKKGHILKINNNPDIWVVDNVITNRNTGLSSHYIRKVMDRSIGMRALVNGEEYRIIGQQ